MSNYAMHPQAFNPPEDRCPDCEYTPSGIFAYPCPEHSCPECGHIAHDDEDGCGHPDPVTGWCECAHESTDVTDEDHLRNIVVQLQSLAERLIAEDKAGDFRTLDRNLTYWRSTVARQILAIINGDEKATP